MTTVLLTGGNGFVGRHVAAALHERGDDVRVLALEREDTSWLAEQGMEVVRGDIRDPRCLAPAVENADAVVHLAAMMDVWRPLSAYHAVNVLGTANVCEAAMQAGVRRFVHMSSSSVYGFPSVLPVHEDAPLRPFRDPYPITKALADVLVGQMARERGFPAVVLRPDQIFGPGDEMHFARTADRLRLRRGIIVGYGDNTVPLIFIADLVQALLLALDHPAAVGQAYNITSAHPLTQRELLGSIAGAIGVVPPHRHFPFSILYAAGWAAEYAMRCSRASGHPPLTRLGVAFIGRRQRFSIEKARRELGFTPTYDLRAAIELTAEWYLRRRVEAADAALSPRRNEARA